MESLKVAETNEPGANVTESPLRVPRAKVENQPSLLEDELEGVSMDVEDLEPQTVIADVPAKDKRDSFFQTIGAELKDAFGTGKESVPAATS